MALDTINTLLAADDDRFQRDAAVVRARMVKAYQDSLVSVQGQLRTIFKKGETPAITELRMAQKLKALEGQLASEIKKLTGVAITTVRNGRNKALIDAYREAGSSLEMGAGVNLNFSRIIPKEAMEYMASDDLWLKALKTHNTVLHADMRKEVEVALRTNARREVITGISTGKSYKEVANAIQERFSVAASRAKTITFTEMHKGHSKGRSEGILQGGKAAQDHNLDVFKVWKHNHVGVPRPEHLAADGLKVPFDKPFRVGGEKLEGPGLGGLAKNNINCHCSVETFIPELETAGALDAAAQDMLSSGSRAQTYTFTPDGLAKLDPAKLSGQGKAIAEAIHSVEGKKVTVDQVTELVKDTLNSKSGNPRTIVAWYMSDWKKKGLLQILDDAGVPKPHVPKVPKVPKVVPPVTQKPSVVTLPGDRPVGLTDMEKYHYMPAKWKYARKASEGEFVPYTLDDHVEAELYREYKVKFSPDLRTYGLKKGYYNWEDTAETLRGSPKVAELVLKDVNDMRRALYDMRTQSSAIDYWFENTLQSNSHQTFLFAPSGAKAVDGTRTIGLFWHGTNKVQVAFGHNRGWQNYLHMDQGHHNVDSMTGVGVFRHEFGHYLDIGAGFTKTRDTDGNSWLSMWRKFRGDMEHKIEEGYVSQSSVGQTFFNTVSKYSSKNEREAFAESFCAFMHPEYGSSDINTLPRELHNYFVDTLKFRERIP
jgi:hypothetical protein